MREPASLRFQRINSYATEVAAQLAGAQGLVKPVAAAQRQAEQMAPVRERMIETQRQLEQWTVMGKRMIAAQRPLMEALAAQRRVMRTILGVRWRVAAATPPAHRRTRARRREGSGATTRRRPRQPSRDGPDEPPDEPADLDRARRRRSL
jgi:hypothetical protein